MKQDYEKMRIALRAWLSGKEYFTALRAMEYAERYHTGTRKDGSPEFSHQVSIAMYAKTLTGNLPYEEILLCVIFLHDVLEDFDEVRYEDLVKEFGVEIADLVRLMSKVEGDKKYTNEEYYANLRTSPITSLAKGLDRVHNLMTMLDGFSPEKQVSYIVETLNYTVPMLKEGRRQYPENEHIYENMKFVMTNQVRLYNALNKEYVN